MHTKLTKLLGIKIPMVSAPMYYASTPAMAATATGAGGFGFIAAGKSLLSLTKSEALVDEIRAVRNILNIPPESPVPMGVGFLGWVLDSTERSDDPRLPAVLAGNPVAIWFGYGLDLGKYVHQVRAYDAKREHKTVVFVVINTVQEAVQAVTEWGVDALVVQGSEAGGHSRADSAPLLSLLPSVLAAIPAGPIILAAGGISTGSQIAGLFTMGADGVVLGSRLLCTPECMYPDESKDILINSNYGCTTRSYVFDEANRTAFWPKGIDGRAIANDLVEDDKAGLSLEERLKRYDDGKAKGETNRLVIWGGDAVGFIKNKESTQTIMHQLYNEAVATLQKSATLLDA